MAPNPNKGKQVVGSYTKSSDERRGQKDGVERTVSDMMTLEVIKKQGMGMEEEEGAVENAKCECCGMSEECSEEYIKAVSGEAVKETMLMNGGGKGKEAVEDHMNACVKFNEMGRSYPVLYQAEAIKLILKQASPATSSSSATSVTHNKRAPLSSGVTVVFLQSLEPPSTTSFLDPSKAKA